MIVYRDRKRQVRPAEAIDRVRNAPPLDALIEFGELESAIADGLCWDSDIPHPSIAGMRATAIALAHRWLGSATNACMDIIDGLPDEVTASTAEGFAWYGLFPETYAEAARQFFRDSDARAARVIGIRSIGTTLSAVVAASLEECGCKVVSYTVRPRGHPFARQLRLADEFCKELRAARDEWFLVVDEGPGLSGSSFMSVARALTELGVPQERIVFFPSRRTDGADLISADARAGWSEWRQYTADTPPPDCAEDLSAGQWRRLFYESDREAPAVHPQHERRKYRSGGRLLKFAGLGHYGQGKLERAEELWRSGFGPRPLGLDGGYLNLEWVSGRPLAWNDRSRTVIDIIARYLRFRSETLACAECAPFERDLAMIKLNVREAMGDAWANETEALEEFRQVVSDVGAMEIDGRMQPFEWIQTRNGLVKTDSIDHHDDHFFPGCQDVAWDLAGAAVEFGLGCEGQAALVDRYLSNVKDRTLRSRMPFYLVGYSTYRMGYCRMASESLRGTADGEKFTRLEARYRATVERTLRELRGFAHA